jgi:hypothetical protein
MSKANFQIYYTGEDLESGQMDVKELAPALLAIGNLIEESNRVLNGDKASVTVKVTAFKDGSFGVDFELLQKLSTSFTNFFNSDPVTAAATLLSFLGISGGGITFGLVKFLKYIKNRNIDNVIKLQDGNIEVVVQDQKVVISSEVLSLYQDIKVRKEVENTVRPLGRKGIDSIKFKHGKDLVGAIEEKELSYFDMPEIEDKEIEVKEASESEFIATFSIQNLSFKEDNKWKLSDGTNTFFVTILDKSYLDKIDKNLVSFLKGDRLKVKLRVKNFETSSGLKTDYEVLEIIEHTKPPTQLPLFSNKGTDRKED